MSLKEQSYKESDYNNNNQRGRADETTKQVNHNSTTHNPTAKQVPNHNIQPYQHTNIVNQQQNNQQLNNIITCYVEYVYYPNALVSAKDHVGKLII